jgi:hypothetical protein
MRGQWRFLPVVKKGQRPLDLLVISAEVFTTFTSSTRPLIVCLS